MLDRIIRESIYNLIREENANDVGIVKESDKYGRIYYYIIAGLNKIGQIRISEITKDEIVDMLDDNYMEKLLRGISFPAYFLDWFYIKDGYRKFGYGRQLLNEVIKDYGNYTLILQAGSQGEMTQAQLVKMYQRYGFKHCGRMGYGSYMIRFPGARRRPKGASFDEELKRLRQSKKEMELRRAILMSLKFDTIQRLYFMYDMDEVYNFAVSMARNGEISYDDTNKIKEGLLKYYMWYHKRT